MTATVVRLKERDRELIDDEVFGVLRRTLGDSAAEDVIEDTAFLLVERLSRMEQLVHGGSLSEIDRLARSIADLAGRVGLRTMQRIAGDVSCCARRADVVALRAVVARMIRIGEDSLFCLARHID
ncbi:MAG: hypothetical protein KatS3mg118_0723 [Paracoccaceae bacterium]|nr:MAG: hypothetical protein KatS3mg118_0723 [Paracoccaceae bacterium]